MKLKELIKKLQRMDEDAPLDAEVVVDTGIGFYHVNSVDYVYGCDENDDQCGIVGVSLFIAEPCEFED